jgi:hypothetical protein
LGATDLAGTVARGDDTVAPWSVWGYTADGFASVVKGALLVSAKPMPLVSSRAGGAGELDVVAAAELSSSPNPNAGLNRFVAPDASGGSTPVFDAAAWSEAAASNAAWSEAAWAEAAWADAAWADAAWADAAWATAAWATAAWSTAAWSTAAWATAAWATAAWDDAAWSNSAEFDAAWNTAAWATQSFEDAAEGDAAIGGESVTPEAESAEEPIFSDDDRVSEEPVVTTTETVATTTDTVATTTGTVSTTLP